MKIWQSAMIALARSRRVTETMQAWSVGSALSRRFVGGTDLDQAIATALDLKRRSIAASFFYLGEYVTDRTEIEATCRQKSAAAHRLANADLDVHISVDPTQIGYSLDAALGRCNAFAIGEAVRGAGRHAVEGVGHAASMSRVLMIDMEDRDMVDGTVALHRDLLAAGLPAGLTLQATLRRTEADLAALLPRPCWVRLVKGAFVAGPDVAFTRRAAIDAQYRHLADQMMSTDAREAGFTPVFGTHDEHLIDHVCALARTRRWPRHRFELEMLYGVRPNLQQRLADEGYRVCVYLPFGVMWWPYAVRRVGESPKNAWFLLRALLTRS